MNKLYHDITSSIVELIFSKLGINNKLNFSILDNNYLLDKKLSYIEDDIVIYKNMWAIENTLNNENIKILTADCNNAYSLIFSINNKIIYGLYYDYIDNIGLLALKDNDWKIPSDYLKATFLSGMEQIKDIIPVWEKCKEYKDLYNNLQSFLIFYDERI